MKTEQIENQKYERISVPHFEGFKCLGYLIPKAGQHIWMNGESLRETVTDFIDTKFLVYEKIPPKRYVFEETGEFRQVKRGELYLSNNGTVSHWGSQYPSLFEHKILRKVDEGQN